MKLLAAVSGVLLGSRLLHSQVPLASLTLAVGAGMHNRSDGTSQFDTAPVPTLRLATTIRLGTSANTRPVVRVEFEPRGSVGTTLVSSAASSDYSYPPLGGVSYALGIAHASTSGLAFAALVGGGRYGGTYRGTRHNSGFAEAEVGQRLGEPAAAFANVQYRQWFVNGERFWYAPVTFGLRLST